MTLALSLSSSACGLTGVEPEEIDLVDDGSEDGMADGGSADDGGATGSLGTEGGDGDGDDSNTSDPGDGDGDSGQDTGDGDGDSGQDTGDGDGDSACAGFEIQALSEGPNPVSIPAVASMLAASCGAPGPERVYSYAAEAEVSVEFSLTDATFDGALYLADAECAPLAEGECVVPPAVLIVDLTPGDVVYVVVDSDIDGGDGTLNVTLM